MGLMPRAAQTRRKPTKSEAPDVPEELRGFPERLTAARTSNTDKGPTELSINTSRLERGIRVRGMTALTAVRLARELGVSVGYLLANESPPEQQPRRLRRDSAPIRAEQLDELSASVRPGEK